MARLFWEAALQQIVPGISFLPSFSCKAWKADRASGPSLPLLREFTHSQGSAAGCLPFFTPRAGNPSWAKRERVEADSRKKSRLWHAHFPPLHSSQVSLRTMDINSLLPNLLDGSSKWHNASNVGRVTKHHFCAGKPPRQHLQGEVWARFHPSWFLASALCKTCSPTASDWNNKSSKAEATAH